MSFDFWVTLILFPLRKLACMQREKNGRSNAEGVSCFLEQELYHGMDKRSAVNPIPISPYLNHKLVVALNKL